MYGNIYQHLPPKITKCGVTVPYMEHRGETTCLQTCYYSEKVNFQDDGHSKRQENQYVNNCDHLRFRGLQSVIGLVWVKFGILWVEMWNFRMFCGYFVGKCDDMSSTGYLHLGTAALITSGKTTGEICFFITLYGKSPFLMGNSTINGHFQ